MRETLYMLTIAACFIAVLLIYRILTGGLNAIQEATGFALALAVVTIPYVLSRSYQEIRRARWEEKLPDRIAEALRKAEEAD